MAIKAVIFDIGNVLIEWHPERFYDAKIGPEQRRKMFAEVDLHGMNEKVDLGSGFRESVFDLADAHPAWRDEIVLWHDAWIEMAAPAIPHSIKLLRALRSQSIPVFVLTNFGVETFDLATAHYPFLEEFDRRYVSGHMQMIKPDARIYEAVEHDCGLAPETLLFADDRADNIAAARARGWQAHLFEQPQGWADCLVKHGLLGATEAAPS